MPDDDNTNLHITISFTDVPADESRELLHALISLAQNTHHYHISTFPMSELEEDDYVE